MKTAQTITAKYSRRNMTAAVVIQSIVEENLQDIKSINFHHGEIEFKDGSWVIASDTTNARAAGLTNYDYALRAQDAAY